MRYIDGSQGEGGGQILRTSLTLSCLTQTPIQLLNIRANRPKPGLQAQHLQAVRAAAAISHAKISGDKLGSQSLYFDPGPIQHGGYQFEIGTAGAATLVLQTIFFPLLFSDGTSTITITGGTHVPWSPSFHYLDWHWLPILKKSGVNATLQMEKAGFYPPGGGEIHAVITPSRPIAPLQQTARGKLLEIRGLSAAGKLPTHVIQRQRDYALQKLTRYHPVDIKTLEMPAFSPGSMLLLQAVFENGQACYFGLGKKGKPAEEVAEDAVRALDKFLHTPGTLDEYLADQLLLPLVLAQGESAFVTSHITEHLRTNVHIIRQFVGDRITIEESGGQPGLVRVKGLGFQTRGS